MYFIPIQHDYNNNNEYELLTSLELNKLSKWNIKHLVNFKVKGFKNVLLKLNLMKSICFDN